MSLLLSRILFLGPWIFSYRQTMLWRVQVLGSFDPFLWNSRSHIFRLYHTLFFRLFQRFFLDHHLQSAEIFESLKLLFCVCFRSLLWSLDPLLNCGPWILSCGHSCQWMPWAAGHLWCTIVKTFSLIIQRHEILDHCFLSQVRARHLTIY